MGRSSPLPPKRARAQAQVMHFYRTPGVLPSTASGLLSKAKAACPDAGVESIATEHCFNVEVDKAK